MRLEIFFCFVKHICPYSIDIVYISVYWCLSCYEYIFFLHWKKSHQNIIHFFPQGVPGKNSSSEVEIIRYQVLIPVTEVQVRASSMKDMDSHFLWELIHLKSQLQRRSEKVYHLSNRYEIMLCVITWRHHYIGDVDVVVLICTLGKILQMCMIFSSIL